MRCREIPATLMPAACRRGFRYIGRRLHEMYEALRDFAHLQFHVNSSLRSELREAAARWAQFNFNMFKNSLGKETYQEEPIFPLVSYNPDTKVWKCVGTGFFIQGYGGFVTAKHVFLDNNGKHLPTLYAIQTTSNMERHIRALKHFVTHPEADIAVGFLGNRKLEGGVNVTPVIATSFTLNFEN